MQSQRPVDRARAELLPAVWFLDKSKSSRRRREETQTSPAKSSQSLVTVIDLSKIDFEALRKEFRESKHRNTDLEILKAAIRAQLEKLIRLNKTRAYLRGDESANGTRQFPVPGNEFVLAFS